MEDRQYKVTAYRWGDLDDISVDVGSYDTAEEALKAADKHEEETCGRYE